MEDWIPLYDKIIVERDPAPEVIGSMTVPDMAKRKQTAGTVIRAGQGRLDVAGSKVTKLLVQEGDRVLFSQFAGVALDPDVPDIIVLREDELLAYVRPPAEEPQ